MCRALSSRASASCRLVQLADSASPSGRYPLSYGLEAFAQHVRLDGSRSTSTLLTLLGDCVRLGVAPSDGVVLACAHARLQPTGIRGPDLVSALRQAADRGQARAGDPREASLRSRVPSQSAGTPRRDDIEAHGILV